MQRLGSRVDAIRRVNPYFDELEAIETILYLTNRITSSSGVVKCRVFNS